MATTVRRLLNTPRYYMNRFVKGARSYSVNSFPSKLEFQGPDNSHCGNAVLVGRHGQPVPYRDTVNALMLMKDRGAIGLDGGSDGWSIITTPTSRQLDTMFGPGGQSKEFVMTTHYMNHGSSDSYLMEETITDIGATLIKKYQRETLTERNFEHWGITLPDSVDSANVKVQDQLVSIGLSKNAEFDQHEFWKLAQLLRYKISLNSGLSDMTLYNISKQIVTAGLTREVNFERDFPDMQNIEAASQQIHTRASTRTEATEYGAHGGDVSENGENTNDQKRLLLQLPIEDWLGFNPDLKDMPDTHVLELTNWALCCNGMEHAQAYATVRPIFTDEGESSYTKLNRMLWGADHQGPFFGITKTPGSFILHTDGRRPIGGNLGESVLSLASNRLSNSGPSIHLEPKIPVTIENGVLKPLDLGVYNSQAKEILQSIKVLEGIDVKPSLSERNIKHIRDASQFDLDFKDYYKTSISKGVPTGKSMGSRNRIPQNPWGMPNLLKPPFVRFTAPPIQSQHKKENAMQLILGAGISFGNDLLDEAKYKGAIKCSSPNLTPAEFDHLSAGSIIIDASMPNLTTTVDMVSKLEIVAEEIKNEVLLGNNVVLKTYSDDFEKSLPLNLEILMLRVRSLLGDDVVKLSQIPIIIDTQHIVTAINFTSLFNLGVSAVHNRSFYEEAIVGSESGARNIRKVFDYELQEMINAAGIQDIRAYHNRGDMRLENFDRFLLEWLRQDIVPYSGDLAIDFQLVNERTHKQFGNVSQKDRAYIAAPYGKPRRGQIEVDPRSTSFVSNLLKVIKKGSHDGDLEAFMEAEQLSFDKSFTSLADTTIKKANPAVIHIYGFGISGMQALNQILKLKKENPELPKFEIHIYNKDVVGGKASTLMLHHQRLRGPAKQTLAVIEELEKLGNDIKMFGGVELTEERIKELSQEADVSIGALGSGPPRQLDIEGAEYISTITDLLYPSYGRTSTKGVEIQYGRPLKEKVYDTVLVIGGGNSTNDIICSLVQRSDEFFEEFPTADPESRIRANHVHKIVAEPLDQQSRDPNELKKIAYKMQSVEDLDQLSQTGMSSVSEIGSTIIKKVEENPFKKGSYIVHLEQHNDGEIKSRRIEADAIITGIGWEETSFRDLDSCFDLILGWQRKAIGAIPEISADIATRFESEEREIIEKLSQPKKRIEATPNPASIYDLTGTRNFLYKAIQATGLRPDQSLYGPVESGAAPKQSVKPNLQHVQDFLRSPIPKDKTRVIDFKNKLILDLEPSQENVFKRLETYYEQKGIELPIEASCGGKGTCGTCFADAIKTSGKGKALNMSESDQSVLLCLEPSDENTGNLIALGDNLRHMNEDEIRGVMENMKIVKILSDIDGVDLNV